MIIDFHAHIYPEKIAEKATAAIGEFYEAPMRCIGSSEELIKSGSKIGVDKYVVHSAATTPKQVEIINNFIIDQTKKYPQFIGFGTIHPDYENFEKELERVKAEGLKGIKVHPDFQKFQADDQKMNKIYQKISDLRLIILFHAGDSRFDFSGPRRIRNVIDHFPELKAIAAHFGGYTEWNDSIQYLVGQNIFFDTSSTFWKLSLEDAEKILKAHGTDKFLFGSDFPMWKHDGEFEQFNKLNISDEEKEKILSENAIKLLGL